MTLQSRRTRTRLAASVALLTAATLVTTTLPAQAPGDPLGPLVAEALSNNLGLAEQKKKGTGDQNG